MLTSLSIRDIVLIDRLDLDLDRGLCVLTGETGAGKSILLDSLGLALGQRGDRLLVREGASQGTVIAGFQLHDEETLKTLLLEHGVTMEQPLLLRRTLGADGRSRAFINDQPVGTGLLRRVGELLVEVHGQHDQQSLADGAVQCRLLDAYGRLEPLRQEVKVAYDTWRRADAALAKVQEEVRQAATDADYWRHVVDELEALAPAPGEEDSLAEARARLMNREKLLDAISDVKALLAGDGGLSVRLGKAQRNLERVIEMAADLLQPAAAAIERVQVELAEATALVEDAGEALRFDGDRLEDVEERLFALRAAARKHKVQVDELPALLVETAARLARLDAGEEQLANAERSAVEARRAYLAEARRLTAARQKAARALAKAVMAELPPLKLEKARFTVRLLPIEDEASWSDNGAERVQFEVATNPGQRPGPLAKIASGGELARLMLALKVVLASVDSTPCLVFDEVDSGVGGATADAIGDRLARLGQAVQVLVVTHAPQVAARAELHLRVEKTLGRGRTHVRIQQLDPEQRREEIARMLAGAEITEAARAAADSLISQTA